jgi:hypothetical protein
MGEGAVEAEGDLSAIEERWREDRLCSLCLRYFEMIGESRDGVDCPLWEDFGDPQELMAKGVVFEDLALYCRRFVSVRGMMSLEEMQRCRRFAEGEES